MNHQLSTQNWKEEFSELLQEVQRMPMKDRARLPRLRVDNTLKKQVK